MTRLVSTEVIIFLGISSVRLSFSLLTLVVVLMSVTEKEVMDAFGISEMVVIGT